MTNNYLNHVKNIKAPIYPKWYHATFLNLGKFLGNTKQFLGQNHQIQVYIWTIFKTVYFAMDYHINVYHQNGVLVVNLQGMP